MILLIAIVLERIGNGASKGGFDGPLTCIDSGFHECTCGSTVFKLIIDGQSVVLGPKTFNKREIRQLQSTNGESELTTYDIFK